MDQKTIMDEKQVENDEPDTSDTDSVRSSDLSNAFGTESGRLSARLSDADNHFAVDKEGKDCQDDCRLQDLGVAKIHRHTDDPRTDNELNEVEGPVRESVTKKFRVDESLQASNFELEFAKED